MAVSTRTLWIAVGTAFMVGCFATYQASLQEDAATHAQSAPAASSSPTTQPSTPPPAPKPAQPAPTKTITVTAPPSDACKLAGELALQARDKIYEVSDEYGDASRIMDKAVKELAMRDFAGLNKQLEDMQDQGEDMSGPIREMTELEPRLEAALEDCKNG